MDRAKTIFGNEISDSDFKKAVRGAERYRKKFGDDSGADYKAVLSENKVIGPYFNVKNIDVAENGDGVFDEKGVVIGNIRMGFGHYRISMAMASAAHALGYTPYWFDLHSFDSTVCGKVIEHQNNLYSMGSRWSQKYALFNLYWERLNSEGFRKLAYNAADQKKAELMAPVCRALPEDIPYIATHVWPAQAAVHAGMTNVVNAIPDNWPMALHLAEGAKHAVQTPSAFLGYKALRGMAADPLNPMPDGSLFYTGHYVDHELAANAEEDCAARLARLKNGKPVRYLMTVGGAGAGKDLFAGMIRDMLPDISAGKAVLLINFGDHRKVYDELCSADPVFAGMAEEHFSFFEETAVFAENARRGDITGIHAFCSSDIFAAVYSTNLLMRCADVLVTKPSELAFYPVPKLMIKHIGGHEQWGAVRTAEIGDGTYECRSLREINAMMRLMRRDGEVIGSMCGNIVEAKKAGIYDGAYNVVKLACSGKF